MGKIVFLFGTILMVAFGWAMPCLAVGIAISQVSTNWGIVSGVVMALLPLKFYKQSFFWIVWSAAAIVASIMVFGWGALALLLVPVGFVLTGIGYGLVLGEIFATIFDAIFTGWI